MSGRGAREDSCDRCHIKADNAGAVRCKIARSSGSRARAASTRLKALVWDGSGLWVCAKRLEKGRFRWPAAGEKQRSVTMRAEELAMLVNGLDLKQTQPRKWYRRLA